MTLKNPDWLAEDKKRSLGNMHTHAHAQTTRQQIDETRLWCYE